LAWFFVNDRVKLAAYRIFDPHQIGLLGRVPTGGQPRQGSVA